MGTLFAGLAERLTGKIAVPLLGVLLLTNLISGVGLGITRHTLATRTKDLATEKRVHLADIEIWKAGAVLALVRDRQHAMDVQAKQDDITKEHENALQEKLTAARAAAAAIVRNYAQTHYNGGKGSNLPQAADAPGGSLEAPAGAFLSAADIEACAVAHTVAVGWQDWYAAEFKIGNDALKNRDDDPPAAGPVELLPPSQTNPNEFVGRQPEYAPEIFLGAVEHRLANPVDGIGGAYFGNSPNEEHRANLPIDNPADPHSNDLFRSANNP